MGTIELQAPRVRDGSFFPSRWSPASVFPRLAALLDAAEADVLAYLGFPLEHWQQIWSNKPLYRAGDRVPDNHAALPGL